MLFPSQTDTFLSWKQVEIKNRDAEQQESAKNLGRTGVQPTRNLRPLFKISSWTRMHGWNSNFKFHKVVQLHIKDVMMTIQYSIRLL